jgi:ankyrin repeat protein
LKLECEIRDRLGRLPEGLKDAYDEIFARIQGKKGIEATIANRALKWVMCSKEWPMSNVLVAAVSQDPEDETTRDPYVDMDFILGACCNLLVVDAFGICQFPHLSVQEYLEEHQWTMDECHGTVLKVCLALLLDHGNLESANGRFMNRALIYDVNIDIDLSGTDDGFTPLDALITYAAERWPAHVKSLSSLNDELFGLVERFLGSPHESSSTLSAWRELAFTTKPSCLKGEGLLIPLQLVCGLGFCQVFSRWSHMGKIDFDNLNEKLENLMVLGVLGDGTQVVQELISKGADVNRQLSGGRHGCVLEAAAEFGSTEMVRILLAAGAVPNALCRSGVFSSALAAAAASRNNVENIRLLLDAGADVNASHTCGDSGSALATAAAKERNNVNIRLLLAAGANVNSLLTRGNAGNAIIAAAAEGHTENIQVLLDAGADVNAQAVCGYYGTALIAAIGAMYIAAIREMGWAEDVVQLLLDAGADANAQAVHGKYSTPLISATCHRDVRAIRHLLAAGADVNALAIIQTPRASYTLAGSDDSEEIVQLRMSMGLVPDGETSRGDLESALSVAVKTYYSFAMRGFYPPGDPLDRGPSMDVITTLLDAGADMDLELVGRYKTALEMAEAYGLYDVQWVLLYYRRRRDEAGN